MIPGRAVHILGISQLVCWGVTYYLVGVFGSLIAADLGWSLARVHGGFSVALVVMGLASPVVGRLVDRYGGRWVLATGSVLAALGCMAVSVASDVGVYYLAWVCLGVAMRCTLYDAAFATLARMGGPAAKRPISQITLLGGLASTVFWPIGHLLAELVGWRGAVLGYAGFALLTLPLHLALPDGRHGSVSAARTGSRPPPLASSRRDRLVAGTLYAVIVTLVSFLAAGMSAHMIGLLVGLGLTASAAVWVAALRGIAQTLARLADVLFGRRVHPLNLNLLSALLLPLCFVLGLGSGQLVVLAVAFTVLYGAGNGLATITRGTLPLALFDHATYGTLVGRLLVPSFFLAAAAPLTFAVTISQFDQIGALVLSAVLGAVVLAAAVILRIRYPFRG